MMAPKNEYLRTGLIARHHNLRRLDENQKGENRKFGFGLYHQVRLAPQGWWENRSCGARPGSDGLEIFGADVWSPFKDCYQTAIAKASMGAIFVVIKSTFPLIVNKVDLFLG